MIGRALLLRPYFLVCDEPTSALDGVHAHPGAEPAHGPQTSVLAHDLDDLPRPARRPVMCDRIAVMYLGRIDRVAYRENSMRRPAPIHTRALIAASLLEENGLLAPDQMLEGEPPSPLNPPTGATSTRVVPMLRTSAGARRLSWPERARCLGQKCPPWDRIGDSADCRPTAPGRHLTPTAFQGDLHSARERPRACCSASPRGFCAGVDRAIRVVEEAIRRHGAPVSAA